MNNLNYIHSIFDDINVFPELKFYILNCIEHKIDCDEMFYEYNFKVNKGVLIVKNIVTNDSVIIRPTSLSIDLHDDINTYRFSCGFDDKINYYRLQIDDKKEDIIEVYEKGVNSANYHISEGVYTAEELVVDAGSDNDRKVLIDAIDSSDRVSGFKMKFRDKLNSVYPSLLITNINLICPKKDVKKYYYERKKYEGYMD